MKQLFTRAAADALRARAARTWRDTGITRAGLYKALSPNGNPSFETVTKIVGDSACG